MASTELVTLAAPAPLLPMEPEQAALMMERYRALCESILTADDVIGVPGQQGGFVKRSGWSKLATFYGVSTEIIGLHIDRDDDGQPTRARAVVRATAANGRHADGDGACAMTEPRFRHPSGRQKIEHDLPATAVTRATNRSVSNLVGFGQVSAEETEETGPPRPYGEVATRGEEDGLLRALEDLGAGVGPANRIVHRAGYLPRIAALSVMFVAAEAVAKQADNGEVTTSPEAAPEAASEGDIPADTKEGAA
jgi:hypothetical protein